jgi:hypothetical protein
MWLCRGVLLQVARSRKYTPSQDDVGFVLKYECSIFDPNHPYIDLGRPMLAFTSRVRPAPNLPVRNLVALPLACNVTKAGPSSRFTVLSYNMLADLYAKVRDATCVLCSNSTCCSQQQHCCQRAVPFAVGVGAVVVRAVVVRAVVVRTRQSCRQLRALSGLGRKCRVQPVTVHSSGKLVLGSEGGYGATPQPGAHASCMSPADLLCACFMASSRPAE